MRPLKLRQVAVSTVAVALCGALVAGCGSSSDASKPKVGGILHVGLVTPSSVDPMLASTVSERVIADSLYDGLTTWDPKTLAPIPSLAERWQQSTDGKSWIFRLRTDLKASNGDPIKPFDVKTTLEAIAEPTSKSPVHDLLSNVVGYDQDQLDPTKGLSGVALVDDRTVRIDLKTPQADLARLLGNPAFGVKHYLKGGTYMSTGSYAVVASTDTGVTMRNVPDRPSYVQQVEVKFYADVATAYAGLTPDKLDWVPIPPDQAAVAGKKYGTTLFVNSLRALYLSFNLKDPRFADQRFREAIIHAINRGKIAQLVSPGVNPLDSVIVNGLPGSVEDACGTTCAYDPAKAKALVKAVFGDATPPVLTIDLASGPPFTDSAVHALVEDLTAAGIASQIRPTTPDAFGQVTVQADRQLFQTSWSAAYPSPEAFLPPLFQTQSPSNVSNFSSAKVDQGIVTAQADDNQGQRNNEWQAVERDVMGNVPVIPLAQFPVDSVAISRVHDVGILPTGNFDMAKVWLS